jgi:hypothetical protein
MLVQCRRRRNKTAACCMCEYEIRTCGVFTILAAMLQLKSLRFLCQLVSFSDSFITCKLHQMLLGWSNQGGWDRRDVYDGVPKSFRTGRLVRELQMVLLSATRCSCIAILWVSLVSFAAITLCVTSQRVFIVVYFVIDSVRKLLDTPSSYACERCEIQYFGWKT